MSARKPRPLYVPVVRNHCPVCGEVSFSRHGIHPQCAARRADERRMKNRKPPKKKPRPQTARSAALRPWHKPCPKCKNQVHVRKATCTCGYVFA